MNMILNYGNDSVAGFNALLDRYSLNHFNSPKRSTVPLLAYWKEPERVLACLTRFGLHAPDTLTLAFEYDVPVQEGKGPPSCTDLMILGQNLAVAVEAKYTEPVYETVKEWLRKDYSENKRAVLKGWLSLINQTTGSQLTHTDVMDLAYQAIHRAASACFPLKGEPGVSRFMVYLLFTDAEAAPQKITRDLAVLRKLIPPDSLRFACVTIRLEKKPAFTALEDRWTREKERLLRDDVMEGLRQDLFFEFSEPVVSDGMLT